VGLYGGVQPTIMAEMVPAQVRCTAVALGYNICLGVIGGLTPLVATWLLHETGTPFSISVYIVVAAVITVVCCLALPDRSRVNIDDSAVYTRA